MAGNKKGGSTKIVAQGIVVNAVGAVGAIIARLGKVKTYEEVRREREKARIMSSKTHIECAHDGMPQLCGIESSGTLCKYHIAKLGHKWETIINMPDVTGVSVEGNALYDSLKEKKLMISQEVNIIERPTYNTLDKAAMAAANIIRHHICEGYDNVEYAIAIYKKIYKKGKTPEYCLAETIQGTYTEVYSDHTMESTAGYGFEADVHSHPISGIQEFSSVDYILSCGSALRESFKNESGNFGIKPSAVAKETLVRSGKGPHPKFIVGAPIDWSKGRAYEKGDIVACETYERKVCIAVKDCIAQKKSTDCFPHDESLYWKEVKRYDEKMLENACWSKEESYKKGNIVTYETARRRYWIAKDRIPLMFMDRPPYDGCSYWEEIKKYQKGNKYNIGDIVLDMGWVDDKMMVFKGEEGDATGSNVLDKRVCFKKMGEGGKWSQYHPPFSRPWTLTMVIPPPPGDTKGDKKVAKKDEEMAKDMHKIYEEYKEYKALVESTKNPPKWWGKSEREILRKYKVTEQQVDVVKELVPPFKWKEKR